MSSLATDAAYLAYQYSTTEQLTIRQDAHRLYSEKPDTFFPWILSLLQVNPGDRVADIGCGNGPYHPLLYAAGAVIYGGDFSEGMVEFCQKQSETQGLGVALARVDAQRLPFANSSFDRLMANHMLYHVPDQMAALLEFRRVVRLGGRVIFATNAADSGGILYDMHVRAARLLGHEPLPRLTRNFTMDDIERVRRVFPTATTEWYRDAFLFPTVESALRYYASGIVDAIAVRPADNSHRAPMLDEVRQQLEMTLAAHGVIRVAKDAGCFTARVE